MKLTDTHAHLYYDHYDHDRGEMMNRTWQDCEAVISIGADESSSRQSVVMAQTDPRIFAAVGVHPHESGVDLSFLDKLAHSPKVVAIGECGLDYKLDRAHPHSQVNKEQQQLSMKNQIELANRLELPTIIHARDCWDDLLPLLSQTKPKRGLVHSFTGGLKEAQSLIDLGLILSFSGILTYPANEHIRSVAAMVPADKFVVETDAPFLPPQQIRGQRNEPAFVKMIAVKIAEIRGLSLEEITDITTTNAKNLFGLPI